MLSLSQIEFAFLVFCTLETLEMTSKFVKSLIVTKAVLPNYIPQSHFPALILLTDHHCLSIDTTVNNGIKQMPSQTENGVLFRHTRHTNHW